MMIIIEEGEQERQQEQQTDNKCVYIYNTK